MLYLTYGMLSSASLSLLTLVTMVLPVTWFPEHRGKVVGLVAGGFGLSSTGKSKDVSWQRMYFIKSLNKSNLMKTNIFLILVFAPLQTFLINPENIKPENQTSTSSYFTDPLVLENVPPCFLYLSASYAILFLIGFILCTEAPSKGGLEFLGPRIMFI